MPQIISDSQQFRATVAFVDKKGNPALVEGAPTWGTSDASILTVTADADGMGALVVAAGPLGDAQVNVTGDADLGEGVTNVVGTLDVTVVAGAAIAANIGAATPEEQP